MILSSINIIETPNPEVMKFEFHQPLFNMLSKSQNFALELFAEDLHHNISELAAEIFAQELVEKIMITNDFLSVTRKSGKSWAILRNLIAATIIDHINAGKEIVKLEHIQKKFPTLFGDSESLQDNKSIIYTEMELSIVKQIQEIIDNQVRPTVEEDGGDIEFIEFKEGIVYVRLKGACSGCPSSSYTLKNGIENMLQHYVPEVTEVRSIT